MQDTRARHRRGGLIWREERQRLALLFLLSFVAFPLVLRFHSPLGFALVGLSVSLTANLLLRFFWGVMHNPDSPRMTTHDRWSMLLAVIAAGAALGAWLMPIR